MNVHDKAFEKGFQLTLEYKKKVGKPNAPQRYITPDGYSLGEWQKTQRRDYKKGVLPPERVKMLEDISFKWGLTGVQVKEQWDFWFELTLKYQEENDTPNAPTKYKTPDGCQLGKWQARQREYYLKKILSSDRVNRLKEIGFVWKKHDELFEKVFEKGFQKTLELKKQCGNPNVSIGYKTPDGYSLGHWQSRQRSAYSKGKLMQKSIKRLEDIGFVWKKHNKRFEEGFQKTLEHKKHEKRFEEGFQKILEHKKHCGNPNVPLSYKTPDGYPLGQWQSNRRASYSRGELSKNRINRLEEIGFIWNKRDEVFEKGFLKTLEFKNQSGNPNAPPNYRAPDGYRLGRWQCSQNEHYFKRKLSREKIKRLEEIGFIWRRQIKNDELFEKGLQLTLEYKKQFGKPDAPLRYKTPDGYSLGTWQCNRRMDYKKGILSADRVERLEGIGLKWSLRKSRKKLL